MIGVEPELAADAQESLREGRIVSWPAEEVTRTICDGVRTQALGELTFATISALVDEIVTVSDEAVLEAMRWLALEAKLLVEPTGALALAAMQTGVVASGGPTVLVASGGNVDAALVASVLGEARPSRPRRRLIPAESGLAAPGRKPSSLLSEGVQRCSDEDRDTVPQGTLVDVEPWMMVRERGAESSLPDPTQKNAAGATAA